MAVANPLHSCFAKHGNFRSVYFRVHTAVLRTPSSEVVRQWMSAIIACNLDDFRSMLLMQISFPTRLVSGAKCKQVPRMGNNFCGWGQQQALPASISQMRRTCSIVSAAVLL